MKKELKPTRQTTRRNFLKTCGKGALVASLPVGTGVITGCANQQGVEKADSVFMEYQPKKIEDLGTTRTLAVLPLIELRCQSGT